MMSIEAIIMANVEERQQELKKLSDEELREILNLERQRRWEDMLRAEETFAPYSDEDDLNRPIPAHSDAGIAMTILVKRNSRGVRV